jgi:hypothetical protein
MTKAFFFFLAQFQASDIGHYRATGYFQGII